jgi:[ribosomal protein S18]-alanine N-acetyltransferase
MDARFPIRPATLAEAAALATIERRCFSDPWSEAAFREALFSERTFGLVAESGRGLAGYLIGREAAGSGEILNLAVAPEYRQRGIGSALLEEGLAAFRRRGATEVFLEVRESNRSAQSLYLARGFRPVGQRAAYYRNPREDALVLRLALHQHA